MLYVLWLPRGENVDANAVVVGAGSVYADAIRVLLTCTVAEGVGVVLVYMELLLCIQLLLVLLTCAPAFNTLKSITFVLVKESVL